MKKERKLKYIVQEVWKVKEAPDDDAFIKYSEYGTKQAAIDRAMELVDDPEILTAVIYRAHAVGAGETNVDVLAYIKDASDDKNAELISKAKKHVGIN